jgi:hypothetical protein
MTQTMYLVSTSQPQIGAQLINGCTAVVINASSTGNAKLNAALALQASTKPTTNTDDTETDAYQFAPNVPSTYFDTAVAVSAAAGFPASGNGSVEGDAWVFIGPAAAPVYVDHSTYTPV